MIAARMNSGGVADDLMMWVERASAPRMRTMREFAEAEIVIPDGKFRGARFRCHRQPYTRLWFDEVDSGRWNRLFATGPTQSGKTLSCYLVPIMYHLFEIGETVIAGLPSMDMAGDKWEIDIKPAILQSRYADLMPTRGAGSKGGKAESITFRNGATLRFMSGGGGDKKRAGFTSRVVVITETDGMDEASDSSREADKITQLEARTRSYGDAKRIYAECTVSIEQGRTWQEYTNGSESKIVLPCPHCGAWVTLERDSLLGWDGVESEIDAAAEAAFYCSACGERWSDDDRRTSNSQAKILHKGQEITPDGDIVGALPPTKTLGFRWSAVNNLFVGAGNIGVDEWKGSRAEDEENADKELSQFVWAVPHQPASWDETPLDAIAIAQRVNECQRGVVPKQTEYFTVGIDVGKWLCHWVAVAWDVNANGRIVDYSTFSVPSDHMDVEHALTQALREFSDIVASGWMRRDDTPRVPDQVLIDSRYQSDVVIAFAKSAGDRFLPAMGYGEGQRNAGRYNHPEKKDAKVRLVGEQYCVKRSKQHRTQIVHINADRWKSWLHRRLSCPIEQAGAMTLYRADLAQHRDFGRHMTAEKEVREFIAGRGEVVKWEPIRKDNHFLDATSLASVAGHLCGVRLLGKHDEDQRPKVVTDWFKNQQKRN